nr:MAG TPA_asm: hypothetical protein [Caudoviricetes sp.]
MGNALSFLAVQEDYQYHLLHTNKYHEGNTYQNAITY